MNSSVLPSHQPETRDASAITWVVCFLLAHHLAVFVHEYAHSFTAFALGYKPNPLQLHFGGAGLLNLLLLSGIDEYVDYQNMFSHGAGWAVGLVALAGPALGNGLTYFLSLAFANSSAARRHDGLALFAFAVNVMSVGNFFSYVPIRTFADHGDIGHIAQALGASPSSILVVLGIPTLGAMWWLFHRTMPAAMDRLASGSPSRQRTLATVTIAIIFGFFGLAGWAGYGRTSHMLSCASALAGVMATAFVWARSLVRRGGAPV
ncbi:hypothetical protein [Variovorax ginsengisoli]|uniref:Peptidase M50 n=1 Tax=Variovorax ginsengisoli TaxID=363844 RepID=A0ABT9SDC5_9BURK|nr:hypothetical protein [Variovorax ginsengisoli]MDP9902361.1 hypothetical protein [Variovorax ginsengisoli]